MEYKYVELLSADFAQVSDEDMRARIDFRIDTFDRADPRGVGSNLIELKPTNERPVDLFDASLGN